MRRAGRSGRVLAEQRAGSELAELRASASPDPCRRVTQTKRDIMSTYEHRTEYFEKVRVHVTERGVSISQRGHSIRADVVSGDGCVSGGSAPAAASPTGGSPGFWEAWKGRGKSLPFHPCSALLALALHLLA